MSKFFKYESKTEITSTGPITDAELLGLIQAEMRGNLDILIDPKKKNSFDQGRVSTWTNVVSERVLYYVKRWLDSSE